MDGKTPDLDGAPSRWHEMLGENLTAIARLELQFATGRGDSEYVTFHEETIAAREVERVGMPSEWFIQGAAGQHSVADYVRDLWHKAHERRGQLEVERGVKVMRARLVIFDSEGQRLDWKATTVDRDKPPMPAGGGGEGLDQTDRASLALVRELRAERREYHAMYMGAVTEIKNIAGGLGGILQGVVAQSNASLAMQQTILDRERDAIEADRDVQVMDYRGRRFFDVLEPIAVAYAKKEGLPVDLPDDGDGGASRSSAGGAGELVSLAREVCDDLTEEHWTAFGRVAGGEAAEDLRTAIESSLMYDATDDATREALRACWPAIEPHKAAIGPIVGMALGLKLQKLGELAQSEGAG